MGSGPTHSVSGLCVRGASLVARHYDPRLDAQDNVSTQGKRSRGFRDAIP